MHKIQIKSLKGFTIIEMVVVMAVFLFVIGAAMGIFISIVQNEKRVLSEQQLINQVSYAEEYMSKALRMADTDKTGSCISQNYIYQLMPLAPSGGMYTGIKFLNASDSDTCQEFFLSNCDPAKPAASVLCEQKWINGVAGPVVPLISSNIQINSVRFSINGGDGSVGGQFMNGSSCSGSTPCGALANTTLNQSQLQPRVTVLLNVNITGEAVKTIQTTVSRRNLNIVQ